MSENTKKKQQPVELDETTMETVMLEEENDNGLIQISHDVTKSIINHYSLKVPGVVRFASKSFTSGLAGFFGNKNPDDESIRIDEVGENIIDVSVTLVLQFGKVVQDVAREVQDIIREKVEELSGQSVNRINVKVLGLANGPSSDEEGTDTNQDIEVMS